MRDAFTEAELDGSIGQQAQRPASMTLWGFGASEGCDLGSSPTINALRSAGTLLIMQCGFKSFREIAALDVIDGGDATRERLRNLRRRHFAVKEIENPSACLQPVSSLARAKESFQRTMFFDRELNELCVSSHC